MKKLYICFAVILISSTAFSQTTYTSVANGDWFNPSTWSPANVPDYNDPNIIINTDVTFNQTLVIGGGAGYCRINAGASLTNISGQDSVIFGNDYFMNNGYVSCGYFAGENNDSTVNYGNMNITNNFIQSGFSINHSSGNICIGSELIVSGALVNDGSIQTNHLINGASITGTGGQFCISNNFINASSISGTVDFCDATPNGIQDVNAGTIAGSVTNCSAGPCSTCSPNSIANLSKDILLFSAAPNPSNGIVLVSLANAQPNKIFRISLYDCNGKQILNENFSGNSYLLNNTALPGGIYLLRIETDTFAPVSTKLIIQ